MADLTTLIYDPSFWFTINIILAAAIIGLVYKQYTIRRRQRHETSEAKPTISLRNEIEAFRQLVSQGRLREAVVKSFNSSIMKVVTGQDSFASKTYPEIIGESSVRRDEVMFRLLQSMYETYERARFGPNEPDIQTCNMFLENLLALNAHILTVVKRVG